MYQFAFSSSYQTFFLPRRYVIIGGQYSTKQAERKRIEADCRKAPGCIIRAIFIESTKLRTQLATNDEIIDKQAM